MPKDATFALRKTLKQEKFRVAFSDWLMMIYPGLRSLQLKALLIFILKIRNNSLNT